MKIINEKDFAAVDIAADLLKAGKIISFPTDTVYGFAVDASNKEAVTNLYQLKNRDQKKPIAIFVKDIASAKKIFSFSKKAEEIAEKFLPGALTLVLPIKCGTSLELASNLNNNHDGFLGFRIVNTDFIKKLFEKFDGIIAVTSANLSGEKEAHNVQEIVEKFLELDLLVDGEIPSKIPSTVAKIIEDKITILRQGSIFL